MNIPKETLLAVILEHSDYLDFQKLEMDIVVQPRKIQAWFSVRMVGMTTNRGKVEASLI